MLALYTFGIRLYYVLLLAAAPFSDKAIKWIAGRKNWADRLRQKAPDQGFDLWMHCSSLGEFEQGRPVLEAYRKKFPQSKILLSFFSPSGYEIRKNYALADHIAYLPLDTPSNAKTWLEITRPKQIIFVKYDFWFNFLAAIKDGNYSSFLISAHFPENHFFSKWPGTAFTKYLLAFRTIFFQQTPAINLPDAIEQVICGDTRVDRVLAIQSEVTVNQELENWTKGEKVFVWGSVWPSDFKLIKTALIGPLKSWKHIIAPHDPSDAMVQSIQSLLHTDFQLLSAPLVSADRKIIVDSIGQLAGLYRYGSAAYIGGGFDKGIHNTLEPMAAGCPVVFGPKYQKFPEAVESLEKKCGFSVDNQTEFSAIADQFNSAEFLTQAQKACKVFIEGKKGATAQIINYLTQ